MTKFLMLGRYSMEGLKGMGPDRTKKFVELISKAGGKVHSMHALLGQYDLAFLVELPSIADAIEISVAISKMTGVAFRTLPVVPVDEFDRITG